MKDTTCGIQKQLILYTSTQLKPSNKVLIPNAAPRTIRNGCLSENLIKAIYIKLELSANTT